MIGKFAWKVLFGFFTWVAYTLEILWVLTFIEQWLDLGWITITFVGEPFFTGVAWVIGFVIMTLFTIFVTAVLVVEPES